LKQRGQCGSACAADESAAKIGQKEKNSDPDHIQTQKRRLRLVKPQ